MRSRIALSAAAAAASFALIQPLVQAAPVPFTPGDIAIYRTGDGAVALSTNATKVFIDEYSPSGTLVQSIPITSAGSGALTAVGNSTTEGIMTLSADSRYLIFTGYRKDAGGATPLTDSTLTTPRVIGRLAMDATLDTSTSMNDAYTGSNIRGAASSDGTQFWTNGVSTSGGANGGVRYVSSLGATTSSPIESGSANGRGVFINNGDLDITSAASNPGSGLKHFSGLPTSTATSSFLIASPSMNGLIMFDENPSIPGPDVLYAADATNSAIVKYSLVSGVWTANGSSPVLGSLLDITGVLSGSGAKLFVTQGSKLESYVDSTGYNTTISATSFSVVASAATNEAFRGLVAVPEPASLTLLGGGLTMLLGRRSRRQG